MRHTSWNHWQERPEGIWIAKPPGTVLLALQPGLPGEGEFHPQKELKKKTELVLALALSCKVRTVTVWTFSRTVTSGLLAQT